MRLVLRVTTMNSSICRCSWRGGTARRAYGDEFGRPLHGAGDVYRGAEQLPAQSLGLQDGDHIHDDMPANGRGFLKLKKPGNGNNDSADVSVQFGA